MLEMMKEWKNNPGSDEESTTDQESNWAHQEKGREDPPSGNALAVSRSSDEEEGKQVWRDTAGSVPPADIPLGAWSCTSRVCCWFAWFVTGRLGKESDVLSSFERSCFSTRSYVLILGSVIIEGGVCKRLP